MFIQEVLSGLMAGRPVSLGDFHVGFSCYALFLFDMLSVAAPPEVHDVDGVTARIFVYCL